MRLTRKQAHVLFNIERVHLMEPTEQTCDEWLRYELDGWECSRQIFSLTAQKRIAKTTAGYVRLPLDPSPGRASTA